MFCTIGCDGIKHYYFSFVMFCKRLITQCELKVCCFNKGLFIHNTIVNN